MPCRFSGLPDSVELSLERGPAAHVLVHATIRQKATVHALYAALCTLPSVDIHGPQPVCSPDRFEAVYLVRVLSGAQSILELSLDTECQTAQTFVDGDIAYYRLSTRVISLIEENAGIPFTRSAPLGTCGATNGYGQYISLPCPTLVQGHPTSLEVTLYRWSGTHHPPGPVVLRKGTTHDPKTVAAVVALFKAAQPYAPFILLTCVGHAVPTIFQFGYSNGDRWTVYDGGCRVLSTHGQRAILTQPGAWTRLYSLAHAIAGRS